MKRSIDWSLWFLIVSGILVSIILNLGVFNWALTIVTSEGWTGFDERDKIKFDFGIMVSLFHFGLFSLLVLFHYKWKNRLIFLMQSKALAISLIVIISFVIYGGVVLIETYFFTHNYNILSKSIAPNYFIWKNIPVAAIAITEAYFIILFKKVKASELEKAQLQEEKSNAQLVALKEQISPHFFFNTLSSLSTIVRNEKKEVGLEFILELSKMYRYTLDSERQQLIELKEELEFVNAYLFIMHKRFGNKLICKMDIPDLYLKMKVPPMSVQLLIENATQHNIITKSTPLTIKVTVEDDMLSVENNLQVKEESEGLGLGLPNLTNRYRLIAEQDIVISKNETTFKVKLPLL